MPGTQQEQVLTVPAELTRKCRGLAIDMGGSVQKYVYRSKEDQEEVLSEDVKYGHLHMVSFSKRDLDEALEYVRHRAVLTPNGPETQTLYTTGLGCFEFGRQICQQLNIKLEQVTEFDCFVKSFVYLSSRLPRIQLLETFLEDAVVEPVQQTKNDLPHFQQLSEDNVTKSFRIDFEAFLRDIDDAVGRPSAAAIDAGDVPLAVAEPDIFPCVLVVCGSGFVFIKIDKDGTHKTIDLSCRGGKSFVAIGSLLTAAESYEELMELAAVGVQRNVDQFTDQLYDSRNFAEGDQSLYAKAEQLTPGLLFCFGKTLGRKLGDLRREDVTRAWLNYVILDLIHCTQSVCIQTAVRRLFFCGGFCSHPLVRRLLTTEFARESLQRMMFQTQEVFPQFDFVKHGSYLGALGCLINDVEKFIGK